MADSSMLTGLVEGNGGASGGMLYHYCLEVLEKVADYLVS